jgi:Ca-activated chloride channel family protein
VPLLVAGFVLGLPAGVWAQTVPQPDAPPHASVPFAVTAPLRSTGVPTALFTATTAAGKPVTALQPANCTVAIQHRPVTIRSLTAAGQQARSFALLLDTAGSQQTALPAEQQAASAIADRLRPDDEAMLIGFDTDITLLVDFTAHRAALDSAIHAAPPNASAGHFTTGTLPPIGKVDGALLYDAVHLAVQRLAHEAGRRILVVIGNGVDQGSRTSLHSIIREAQQASVTVYVLLVRDTGMEEMLEVSGKRPMQQLAQATGGTLYTADARGEGLKPAIRGMEAQMAGTWRATFDASTGARGVLAPLRIRCRQNGHALRIRAPQRLEIAR